MENMNKEDKVKIVKVVILCMFVFFAVFSLAIFSFIQVGNLKRKNAQANEYILALETEEQNLQKNLDNTKNEDYVDNVARDDLNMIKEDETIYYFE